MRTSASFFAYRAATASAAACAAMLGACASGPQVDAEWKDAQLSPTYLHGARVLVACDAPELVVRQLCQDRLSAELVARGATPVPPPGGIVITPDRPVDSQLLPAARDAGAKGVLVMTVAVAITDVNPGPTFSIGGFGFGGGGGVGVGVAAPLGGGRVTSGYTANGRLTDVPSGRLVWTAKATTPPSQDVNAQLGDLSKSVVGSAERAGLF